ncbi:hypothetical protein BDY21DRAFT_335979 [Lineolata rhizophorae]|uniref:Uncharacterized protein n=1 Tax=Lineolata rhizophorae TaxID=578093 RepID=A0A6A6P9M3_9PEZI|nr:hypothetical protein BDY21DRAFT_335979 [Lineolata rhizophorae]
MTARIRLLRLSTLLVSSLGSIVMPHEPETTPVDEFELDPSVSIEAPSPKGMFRALAALRTL